MVTYIPYIQCERLMGGMQKIAEASVQLNELNDKLAVQKVAVTEKTGDELSSFLLNESERDNAFFLCIYGCSM